MKTLNSVFSKLLLFAIPIFLLSFQEANLIVPTKSENSSIAVLSFNIRYNNPKDGTNAWPHRKDKVAGLIRFHKVEIVGLQEVLIDQRDELINLLPEFACLGVGRTDGKEEGEFAPIMYLKERFNLLDDGTIWLSETPSIPSKGWDAALNRIVTWGKFEDNKTGEIFFFFNTHFDHRGKTARKESARLLLNEIQNIALESPVVVTGDFNFESGDIPYEVLTETPGSTVLYDAQYLSEQAHYGPVSTYGGGFDEACKTGKKIDYIFTKNQVNVKRHGVLTDSWAGICPSDHMPVYGEIYFKD